MTNAVLRKYTDKERERYLEEYQNSDLTISGFAREKGIPASTLKTEVFLMGKIITDIEFKFIIHSKNISIAQFKIMVLDDKQVIQIAAYNEMADLVYSKLNKNDMICINGYIADTNVIIKTIDKI